MYYVSVFMLNSTTYIY